jgi:hypothetical protein
MLTPCELQSSAASASQTNQTRQWTVSLPVKIPKLTRKPSSLKSRESVLDVGKFVYFHTMAHNWAVMEWKWPLRTKIA